MFGNSSSVDTNEIIKSFDSNSDKVINSNEVAFSKKAQNQCDADENLFLRFLELDPQQPNDEPPRKGRTPFTITKKLFKNPENSFGFSIVWTHPPRVEIIEGNTSAEKAEMRAGDYIIFIDKYNIVTMPGKEKEKKQFIVVYTNARTKNIILFHCYRTRHTKLDSYTRQFTNAGNFSETHTTRQHKIESFLTEISLHANVIQSRYINGR